MNSQLVIAFLADLVFADPEWLPHPVRLLGRLIQRAEHAARRVAGSPQALRWAGLFIAVAISLGAGIASWLVLQSAGKLSPAFSSLAWVYLAYTTLSVRGLDQAGRKVIELLQAGDLQAARSALGMIVGRDTDKLDAPGIVRAVVETVAENTSDGVVAPLLYLSLGGVPCALTYKAINTLDSMIGHKNERYLHFGWAAARLDDVANYLPSRLTALLVTTAAAVLGFSWTDALRAVRRDARLQPSPNSGFPEAAYAGALGIRLGGLNFYNGRPVRKAFLGSAGTPLVPTLYPQVRKLLYASSTLMLLLSLAIVTFINGFV